MGRRGVPGVVQTFGCGMAATAAATTVNCATKALAKLKRLWASELGKACVGRNSRYCEVFVDLTPIPPPPVSAPSRRQVRLPLIRSHLCARFVSTEHDSPYWAHVLRGRPVDIASLLGDSSWLSHKLHGELKGKVVAEV